jgi:hypothetical protein
MTIVRLTAYLGLAGAAAAFQARADESNYWPAYVKRDNHSGQEQSWSAAGPFLFSAPRPAPDPGRSTGLRPFYVTFDDGESRKADFFYPLFFHRTYPGAYKWSILNLINGSGNTADAAAPSGPIDTHFDVWPFYFSHETGDPEDSYRALFPIYGIMKYRLWCDRISWVAFPLYIDAFKEGTHVTYAPWPFVQISSGATHGFGIWPLFSSTKGPGPARNSYFLWPFGWKNTVLPGPTEPDDAAPSKQFGILPFYERDEGPGTVSEDYLWPFFGYIDRTSPDRFSEKRYFWPFLVQGRGDAGFTNRWGPVYTHSNVRGLDSKWVMWPFWHRTSWVDDDIAQSRTQFFYFLYWSLDQRSVSRPAAQTATKRHIWPFVSIWDNGAGSRQIQALSPFEVFFPENTDVREAWTPLFALYRYDHRPTGESRVSVLWDAVTWRRDGTGNLAEFHLGPLLAIHRGPEGPGGRILGFDFGAKPGNGRLADR